MISKMLSMSVLRGILGTEPSVAEGQPVYRHI